MAAKKKIKEGPKMPMKGNMSKMMMGQNMANMMKGRGKKRG
jgi:hypothetical protein